MKKGQVDDWTDFMIAFFLLLFVLSVMFVGFQVKSNKVKGEIKLDKENFRLNSEMLSYLRLNVDDKEIRDVIGLSKVEGDKKKFKEKSSEMFNDKYGTKWSVNVLIPGKDFKANSFKFFLGKVVNFGKNVDSYFTASGVTIGSGALAGSLGLPGLAVFYFAGDDIFEKMFEKRKEVLNTCEYSVLTGVVPLAYLEDNKYGVVNLMLCEE